jgi:dTDP-4-amino-4,6-dideoxygalactose transaminase
MENTLSNSSYPKIWLSPPHLSGHEQLFINEAIASNWVAPVGPQITLFEKQLCEFTGAPYAVALNSGTSAIHLAIKCLEIKPGQIIFCSTFSFVATANPIVYENAIPYFIESEEETWNMCPIALENAIQKAIANKYDLGAIIVVHLYGNPAKMDEIKTVAQKYNLPVIEDAAEALGSTYQNQPCGTLTDLGIISFNGNKIITTSGGGSLLTQYQRFATKALYLATQAKENTLHYEHHQTGYNYRISNIAAAIGCGQMQVIHDRVKQRRLNFTTYQNITFQPETPNGFSNRWLTCILFENQIIREKVEKALLNHHIECRPLWKPLHSQPIFKNALYEGNQLSEALFLRGLCLPSGSNLTLQELALISALIIKNSN